ncbi:pentatricopeptide repeat-containing protein At1g06140, mitochondrial-like [Punica granatum]|uniref:Uncharacterized protein n=2 Tax=Punica granatum TaxID=22663 RepID=A0A218VTZ6_PUNGR|nr:pentatricopeptide repeat-containing protein At1g06140, mitochondrial-like [Punica granatum]OWM63856.1 hypothetical protein CDL15_Pgr006118 [Punica granatum]PKI68050.1 hypothetical protein CRG98_011646 [Punica granatum]
MLHFQRSSFPPFLLLLGRHRRLLLPLRYPVAQPRQLTTLTSLFNLCTSPKHLQQVHTRFILHGLHQNPSVCSELINCYASLGLLETSEKVFGSIIGSPSANIYGAMIRNLPKSGEFERILLLYRELVQNGMLLDEGSYPFVLHSCSCLSDVGSGMGIHGQLMKLGLDSTDSVATGLLEMYRNWGRLGIVEQVDVDISPIRGLKNDWNSLIYDASRSGNPEAVFSIFSRMRAAGARIDSGSVVNLLRSCVDSSSLGRGRLVHSLAVVSGLSGNLSVNTALLYVYAKLGSLDSVQLLFDKMPDRNCVVWNITISAFTQKGYPKKSMDLLRSMVGSRLRPDLFTVMAFVPAVSQLKSINHGKELHTYIIRNCLGYQVSVDNSMIGMYCECNHLDYALKVFDVLAEKKTEVSWSTMIKGYVANDQALDALSLFSKMRSEGVEVDFVTVINILPAYVNIGALEQVRYLHSYTIKSGLVSLPSVRTAILVSYAKCGSIDIAKELFDGEEDIGSCKDVISWNAMISAYARHGNWPECFDLYDRMKRSELSPDHMTFLGLLTACVNSGRVEEGKEHFRDMTTAYGLVPGQEHYASMVDLLGRSGRISEAKELISSMPFEPDARVWGPLLSACRAHSETQLAELAAEKLIGMEPENAGNYVLLSNVYAASGKWEEVAKMRRFLRDKCLKKNLGCSWVEINGTMNEFQVADRSHEKWEDIYGMLENLELESKGQEGEVL